MTQANGLVDLKPPTKGAGVAGADMRRRLQLCGTSGAQRHRPCALRGQMLARLCFWRKKIETTTHTQEDTARRA